MSPRFVNLFAPHLFVLFFLLVFAGGCQSTKKALIESPYGLGGAGASQNAGGQGGVADMLLAGEGGDEAGSSEDMGGVGGDLILVGGMGGDPISVDEGGSGGQPCTDCDEDGFTVAEGDCNDENAAQNPDAEELCDGVDNNCSGFEDDLPIEPCYDGDENTRQVGLCQDGARSCVNGNWGDCLGQTLPDEQDLCGSGSDENCNGEQNESCAAIACDDIDLDSQVELINSCLVSKTDAKALAKVTLNQNNGNPLPNANLQFSTDSEEDVWVRNEIGAEGHQYYGALRPPNVIGEYKIRAEVQCDSDGDGQVDGEVRLRREPEFNVVSKAVNGTSIRTGGCHPMRGNVEVKVLDQQTGQPIQDAWAMVGLEEDGRSFVTRGVSIVRGNPFGDASNVEQTNEEGVVSWTDFAGNLDGPQIISVSAAGFETVTLSNLDASHAIIALRSIPSADDIVADLEDFSQVSFSGTFTEIGNLVDNDTFLNAGILFQPLSLRDVSNFSFESIPRSKTEDHGFTRG